MLMCMPDHGDGSVQLARSKVCTPDFAWRLYSAVKPALALMVLAVTAVVLRMEYTTSSARVEELERLVVARLLLMTPRSDAFIE